MRYFTLTLSLVSYVCFVCGQTPVSVAFSPPPAASGAVASSNAAIPNSQWSTLLGNVLWFYAAQRSGALGSENRVPWRNDSALNDGSDVNLDLSGGYYDAGDYIKATYPLSFTLASIAWGGIDFGRGFDLANQTSYLDQTLRWGLDWMIKAHPSPQTLYVQVADTNIDNNYWGGDQDIPTPRPSFAINASAPGTDAAASSAAAFAAASYLYRGAQSMSNSSWSGGSTLVNTSYADTLLSHATTLFAFATNTTQAKFSTSVPGAAEAYSSSGVNDSLVWGGLWLYLATNTSSYLDFATDTYNAAGLNGSNAVFNWDSKVPGLPLLMVEILKQRGEDATSWQVEMERYFDRILGDTEGKHKDSKGLRSYLTSGGLLYYPGDSDSASLNPAANAAMLMFRYAPLASSTEKGAAYRAFADSQLAYFLGQNPMNRPYIVGVHPNAPTNPHSAMAAGGSNINDINNSPPTEANVLYGGVVGGPDEDDQFYNERSDYVQTEIALDYNAPFVTLAAYNAATNASDPTYVSLQGDAVVVTRSSNGLSTGAKVGIAIGVVLGVAMLCWLGWFCWRGRNH